MFDSGGTSASPSLFQSWSDESEPQEEKVFFSIDKVKSTVGTKELKHLRSFYFINKGIELRECKAGDVPSRPPPGEVTLHTSFFQNGLRLPFHPVFREILYRWGTAPGQLNPNVWRAMIGCFILWEKEVRASLTAVEFLYLYRLKACPNSAGWYYANSWEGEALITHNQNTVKDWKHTWFFATKNWETPTPQTPPSFPVPTTYIEIGPDCTHLFSCCFVNFPLLILYLCR